MNYLLDVNVLEAWGWSDHGDHLRVDRRVAIALGKRGSLLYTSAIPQLGFVRVSVQRGDGKVSPEVAGNVLSGLIRTLGASHRFLADDQDAVQWPSWCNGAAQTTNAHGLALATLDKGIPGAFLIP